jgi:hypothetical protein
LNEYLSRKQQGITSLHSHDSRLNFAQQHPSDAVFSRRSKLCGIDPQRLNQKFLAIATQFLQKNINVISPKLDFLPLL